MSLKNKSFYWVGEPPTSNFCEGVILVNQIEEVPVGLGGMVCISYQDTQQMNHALKAFFKEKGRWSWAVYVTVETPYSRCIADGVFEEVESKKVWRSIQSKIDSIDEPDVLDPLIGWLGVNRQRRVSALKSLESTSIYSFPIIDLLFPDIYSTYRYVLSEQGRGVLEPEALIDRIRVCSHCNSGHLNYVEVCPDCSSIDIDSQSSLHCFTCGHVGEQHSFQRRGKLECPKCLTQLRHIGVDYDRPLENHVCHSCSSLFVEAATISQCLSCDSKIKVEELVVRKIYQYRLGEVGEYIFQHGKSIQAPELSIKGKVEVSFFQNLLAWLNKVALRHKEQHLLLGLHLPTIDEYGKQYGDAKLFSLMDQLTRRLSGLFRDTDICCQYKQDVLLVLMPNTTNASLSVLQQKLSDLGDLVEDEEFELDVFAWDLPDPAIEGGVSVWIESLMGEIYAAR
ncbi:diguanylate cyclase [Vibrio parahaemolyticus]|uniref:TackOD1 domain-containing metal-binding protein n=1 Tax=Vibrio parahaemolyticus TaxID=670 RepID=UPI0015DFB0AC|nr:diguanylate cyclase [Vibrio parahaemolyticus]MCG9642720.1 diguanylate cyclase [Vibrio parahaemolyticus]MDS1865721.1 diguanylate cyclase [Vibrio parahaemolyticus]QUD95201.1 diguanylate cyclase [Vibrio parahaemolyticus]HCG5931630.1 diguanylate cyclase [Vibrio parahaemolyticus]HCG7058939.1 diguanylate cyclase [Vibrio parahaemolyticus]